MRLRFWNRPRIRPKSDDPSEQSARTSDMLTLGEAAGELTREGAEAIKDQRFPKQESSPTDSLPTD